MIHALHPPMPDEPMRHYLLTPYEAELLAIFRLLPVESQSIVANVMATQCNSTSQVPVKPAEIYAVK